MTSRAATSLCFEFLDELEDAGISEADAAAALVAVGLMAKFRAELPARRKGLFDLQRNRMLKICEGKVVPAVFVLFSSRLHIN